MKQIAIYIFVVRLLVQASNAASFYEDIACVVANAPLIDGKNLRGDICPYLNPITDLHRLDNDTELAWSTECLLRKMLQNPIKETGWMYDTLYTADEFNKAYSRLTLFSFQLNPSALRFFWHILEDGNVYGTHITDLTPQPERAALFKELYEWRIGQRPDAEHAIEAIRIERKRIDASAAEEEKRAAGMAEKEARNASDTSGLRRRHVSDAPKAEESSRSTVKDPLIPRSIKAH